MPGSYLRRIAASFGRFSASLFTDPKPPAVSGSMTLAVDAGPDQPSHDAFADGWTDDAGSGQARYPGLDQLTRGCWRFRHGSGFVAAERLTLMADGQIGGYEHENERRWRLSDGAVEFLSDQGVVSTRFDRVGLTDGQIELSGDYLLDPSLEITLCLEKIRWREGLPEFSSQTKYSLQAEIAGLNWVVGNHTYGKPTVYASGPERLIVGKYTSIGGEVTIVLAGHRPDYVSTYPFALFRNHWRSVPDGVTDHRGKGDVRIGSDVWIGHGAFIGPGVVVSDGAVIAALAVVTKDVPPYAIVAGNPARVIRFRFESDVVDALLQVRWWDWPDEKVDAHLPLILDDDITAFLQAVRPAGQVNG